ncbi:MAG: hypothetical protein R2851_05380 [Caldilineaceae bacterium]
MRSATEGVGADHPPDGAFCLHRAVGGRASRPASSTSASGQFVSGTVFAVFVGVSLEGMPAILHGRWDCAGFVGGMLWGAIPGILSLHRR